MPIPLDRWRRRLERLAVFVFAALWLMLLVRVTDRLVAEPKPILLLLALVAGHVAADAIAGAVHWLADRYFDPNTPVLGALLIEPFRAHHDDPLSIARHDFFEVSGNNALLVAPVVAALHGAAETGALGVLPLATGLSACLSLFATNLFHAWAHAPAPPRLARALQHAGLILRPAAHARHHRLDHDCAYCVTSGWLNPLFDRLRLFERLEHAIDRIPRARRLRRGGPHPSAGEGAR
ncbi:MAG: carotenoid synthesis regulator CarF [Myxococcales bacterium]|nr:carotenoid synthesis regulator CarF [Myxococcales bacterium]